MKNIKVVVSLFLPLFIFLSCNDKEDLSYDKDRLSTQAVDRNNQKWWKDRHLQIVKDLKNQDVDLLMLGDSITHFWETKNPKRGGKKIWDKYYSKRNAYNIGYSADRTEHVLWRLKNGEADGISPKLIVIMIGTNNVGHRKEKPEDTAYGIKAIIKEIRKRLPDSKIMLLAIFPRGPNKDDPKRKLVDATNKIICNYADNKNVFYLDINDKFLNVDGTLPKTIMPDLLHPNEKGYEIWANAMESKIKELLGE